jgi:D-hexose-6-phosphate mutarotase
LTGLAEVSAFLCISGRYDSRMNSPKNVRQVELAPGYPVLEIKHAAAQARVALHGAQLMEWTPGGQQPVIYLSPQAVYRDDKAVRGGIPVCWPWFGHHADPKLPQHGFVRTRIWEVAEATEDAAGVKLKLTLQDDEATRRLWPHAFGLALEMHLGAELHVSLRMENTDAAAVTITGALHTYFCVGNIRQVTIEGLDGASYLDTVGPHTERKQSGDIAIDREVDRIYRSSAEVRIRDKSLGRVISIQDAGSQSTVVWNPWIEKARALADLPDEDYVRFVCVETANAWNDQITLAPGAAHELAATIRLQ